MTQAVRKHRSVSHVLSFCTLVSGLVMRGAGILQLAAPVTEPVRRRTARGAYMDVLHHITDSAGKQAATGSIQCGWTQEPWRLRLWTRAVMHCPEGENQEVLTMTADKRLTPMIAAQRRVGGRSRNVPRVVVVAEVETPPGADGGRSSRRWFFPLFLFVYVTFFNCRWWELIEAVVP